MVISGATAYIQHQQTEPGFGGMGAAVQCSVGCVAVRAAYERPAQVPAHNLSMRRPVGRTP